MSILKNVVAEIHYILKDHQAEFIDSSEEQNPLAYIHGMGQLIPGLEKELEGNNRLETKFSFKFNPKMLMVSSLTTSSQTSLSITSRILLPFRLAFSFK